MSRSPSIPSNIALKLRQLRGHTRRLLAMRGLAELAGWAALGVAVSLPLDWWFRMDLRQRGVLLAAAVVFLAVQAYRRWLVPLTRPLGDEHLCLRLEATNPQLGQAMISAWQLAQIPPGDAQGSEQLVRRTIELGQQRAATAQVGKALDAGYLNQTRKRLALSLSAWGLIVLAFVLPASRSVMWTWLDRNVLLGSSTWPQYTHLAFVDRQGTTWVLPRGDDLEPMVQARGTIPSAVYLEVRPLGQQGMNLAEEMTQVGERNFQYALRSVMEPVRLRARGGDGETPWVTVQMSERPRVSSLKITHIPPAYTGQPALEPPMGDGTLDVLKGSRVILQATANKPLNSMALQLEDRPVRIVLQPAAQTQPASQTSQPAGVDVVYQGEITGANLQTGTYTFQLKDQDGLQSRRPTRLNLRVMPDRKPLVRAQLKGVTVLVTPNAVAPVQCKITDDFAVQGAQVVAQVVTEGQTAPAPQTQPIAQAQPAWGQPSVSATHRLEVASVNAKAGQSVVFFIRAQDNDNVSGPNVGQSSNFFLKVVTAEELRADLLRREQEMRQRFEVLLKDQEDLHADARVLAVSVRGLENLPESQQAILMSAQKRQKLIGERCAGVAQQFALVLEEIANNRLEEENGPAQQRLSGSIIAPLEQLAGQDSVQAGNQLESARQSAAQPGTRDPAIEQALVTQARIIAQMRQILRFMEKWEGYQEALALLNQILKAQGEVTTATRQELEHQLQSIFTTPGTTPGSTPGTTPAPGNKPGNKPAPGTAPAPASGNTPGR